MILSIFRPGNRRFLRDSMAERSGFIKKINILTCGDQSEQATSLLCTLQGCLLSRIQLILGQKGSGWGCVRTGLLSVAADPLTLDGEVSDRRGAAAERD